MTEADDAGDHGGAARYWRLEGAHRARRREGEGPEDVLTVGVAGGEAEGLDGDSGTRRR